MTIRSAFSTWPLYNAALRKTVEALTPEQLLLQPTPDRWPLWASIGHLCCQRVSGLCGMVGEPGAETTPFPNALYSCPGDEYLEPAMSGDELLEAIDSTFRIIEGCLATWTYEMLDEVIERDFGDEKVSFRRGFHLQSSLAHDVYHIAELNEAFSTAGLPLINLWE